MILRKVVGQRDALPANATRSENSQRTDEQIDSNSDGFRKLYGCDLALGNGSVMAHSRFKFTSILAF